jgi:hypothetical protein
LRSRWAKRAALTTRERSPREIECRDAAPPAISQGGESSVPLAPRKMAIVHGFVLERSRE